MSEFYKCTNRGIEVVWLDHDLSIQAYNQFHGEGFNNLPADAPILGHYKFVRGTVWDDDPDLSPYFLFNLRNTCESSGCGEWPLPEGFDVGVVLIPSDPFTTPETGFEIALYAGNEKSVEALQQTIFEAEHNPDSEGDWYDIAWKVFGGTPPKADDAE